MNRSVKQSPEVILKHKFPIPPVHRQTSVSRVGFNSEPFCFLMIWRWNLRREEIGTRHTASRPSQFPYEPQSANRFPSMLDCKRHNTTKKYSNRPSASFFLFILCRIRSNNIHCRAIFKWVPKKAGKDECGIILTYRSLLRFVIDYNGNIDHVFQMHLLLTVNFAYRRNHKKLNAFWGCREPPFLILPS